MIRVVKIHSHRVEFFSFYRGNMVGKAETHFFVFVSPTYCIPHLLHEITYITLGVSHWDLVLIVYVRPVLWLFTFWAGLGYKQVLHLERLHYRAPLWWFLISDVKVTVGAREPSPNQYITEVTGGLYILSNIRRISLWFNSGNSEKHSLEIRRYLLSICGRGSVCQNNPALMRAIPS